MVDGLRYCDRFGYNVPMKTELLSKALERIENWPADAQDQLAEIAFDIDASLKDVVYQPTDEESAGIERGLRDAAEGRFATDKQVEAALARLRNA
jgi:predicted transcriptional regulator